MQADYEKPVYGCVLIGGKSRRMGSPKHLLTMNNGFTWLEHSVSILEPLVERVVISGSGEVPASLCNLTRIDDVVGVAGPLSGILAVMRWRSDVSWLVVACDMPNISTRAVSWLLEQRQHGAAAVMVQLAEQSPVEPLFAWYDGCTLPCWERMAECGEARITGFVDFCSDVKVVRVPNDLLVAWKNVNTAGEL